jgi:hypothetical protein
MQSEPNREEISQVDVELKALIDRMSADPRIQLPPGDYRRVERTEDGGIDAISSEIPVFYSRQFTQALLARAGQFWQADTDRAVIQVSVKVQIWKDRFFFTLWLAIVCCTIMGYWLYVAWQR